LEWSCRRFAEYLLDNSVFTGYLAGMVSIEETRARILGAAMTRIMQYGFNKTTMAEIAGDCEMSAANIYRFFENKGAIVAELASGCFRDKEEGLREVLRRPGLTATERLEEFVFHVLRHCHAMLSEQPKAIEVLAYISSERHDIIDRHKEVKQSLLAEILAEGNRNGEFVLPDVVATAEAFLQATIFFSCPINFDKRSLADLEREARAVINLLVRGMK